MVEKKFPVIDMEATGKNIIRLRKERGLTVRDLQTYFGFEEPQAIYKWQNGKSLPSVDNLYALGALLEVPMEKILVSSGDMNYQCYIVAKTGRQAMACRPLSLIGSFEYDRNSRKRLSISPAPGAAAAKKTAWHRRAA